MEGKILNKFDMRPHDENIENYRKLCRERTNKYMKKGRQIQVLPLTSLFFYANTLCMIHFIFFFRLLFLLFQYQVIDHDNRNLIRPMPWMVRLHTFIGHFLCSYMSYMSSFPLFINDEILIGTGEEESTSEGVRDEANKKRSGRDGGDHV